MMTRAVRESGIKSGKYKKTTNGPSSLLPFSCLRFHSLSNPDPFKVSQKFNETRHEHKLHIKTGSGGYWREQRQERPLT